jgi:hypothetical protein
LDFSRLRSNSSFWPMRLIIRISVCKMGFKNNFQAGIFRSNSAAWPIRFVFTQYKDKICYITL